MPAERAQGKYAPGLASLSKVTKVKSVYLPLKFILKVYVKLEKFAAILGSENFYGKSVKVKYGPL